MLRLLLSPRWLFRHVLMVALVAGCLAASRWQYGRAVERHSIQNWSYTVEWVLFGGFVVLGWAWFLRDELRERSGAAPVARVRETPLPVVAVAATTEDEDPELAAYNRYLAELAAKRG